jgi:SAM-dependent methyltransferase
MANSFDHVVASRAAAYDRHYLSAGWQARSLSKESAEAFLSYAIEAPRGGHINGNEIQHALHLIDARHLAGKRILDYCCGTGITAIYFALCGAEVAAFDYSGAALELAMESARRSGVAASARFAVADARLLPYDSQVFDAAFCQSALHIVVDYPECPRELARVLKPGAKAVFCEEALGYNPAFGLLRYIRRRAWRECGGRPLTYGEIRRFGGPFSETMIHHFNLLGQAKNFFQWAIQHEGRLRPHVCAAFRALERFDRRLLGFMPALRKLCGKVVVEYTR